MGNCQAADAAAVVIQHPGDGKVERLYWPATAADIMRKNPGHYVALVVIHVSGGDRPDPAVAGAAGGGGARITKVKLLKPKDTLLLGQVYRLITSQEVTKALQARREEKMRICDEVIEQQRPPHHHRRREPPRGDAAADNQEQRRPTDHQERRRLEKDRHRSRTGGGGRGRHWRPSLQSITESSSRQPDCDVR